MKIGAQGARAALTAVFAACGVWLLIDEVRLVVLGPAAVSGFGGRTMYDCVLATLTAVCVARAVLRREQRAAWLLVSLGLLAWTFGEIYYNAAFWTASNPPVPSPADGGYLMFYPFCLTGLMLLLRHRAGSLPALTWVDGATTAMSVGALSAAVVFQTVLRHDSGAPASFATALAYPVIDMILLAAVLGALARMGWRADRAWLLLAAGLVAFWVADSLYEMQTAAGTYHPGEVYDLGWYFGFYLIAAAAWQRRSARLGALADASTRRIAIPLLFGGVALALLVYGTVVHITWLATVLAATSLVGLMLRLLLTFRQNAEMLRHSRSEALADPLTGLGNRRALTRRLEAFFDAGEPDERLLILFDLDGFKAYNDRFGHPAGDALLRRLTGRLSCAVGAGGEAFRMGGDEFCALVPAAGAAREATLTRLAGSLSDSGDGFAVSCSYGAITLPGEAHSLSDALRSVDQRMYAQKQTGRMSAERQARDVLVHAMREGAHGLHLHGTAVASLAEQVAVAMGLSDGQVSEARQAGELHDIGKLAVPDEILSRRGPLPDGDRALIQEHACAGERIIAAAPALAHIARLVRHSHERWDGAGYPDGLAGEAIPLGARIIAVADAYETLTGPQPYRPPVDPALALRELRRHAGTQFDPAVVAALAAVQDQGAGVPSEPALAPAPGAGQDVP